MGFEQDLFLLDNIDSLLICPICKDVLENAIQTTCNHTFCYTCIDKWIHEDDAESTCPIDRSPIVDNFGGFNFFPIAKDLRNLIFDLEIKCKNRYRGCTFTTKLGTMVLLSDHNRLSCYYDTNNVAKCPMNKCGLLLPKARIENHDCVNDLMNEVSRLEKELKENKEILETKKEEKGALEKMVHNQQMAFNELEHSYEEIEDQLHGSVARVRDLERSFTNQKLHSDQLASKLVDQQKMNEHQCTIINNLASKLNHLQKDKPGVFHMGLREMARGLFRNERKSENEYQSKSPIPKPFGQDRIIWGHQRHIGGQYDNGKMVQVFVKLNNKTYTFLINPSETVHDLKLRIEGRTCIPSRQYFLTCSGKYLDRDINKALSHYGVEDGSTIHLCLRACQV